MKICNFFMCRYHTVQCTQYIILENSSVKHNYFLLSTQTKTSNVHTNTHILLLLCLVKLFKLVLIIRIKQENSNKCSTFPHIIISVIQITKKFSLKITSISHKKVKLQKKSINTVKKKIFS